MGLFVIKCRIPECLKEDRQPGVGNCPIKRAIGPDAASKFWQKTEVSLGEAVVDELQTVAGYTRRKGHKSVGRTVDTSILPRHKIIHDLSEADKQCTHCHHALSCIGQDVSEQLEVIPLKLYVAEHIRYRYACTHCQTVQMAPKPLKPLRVVR